MKEDARLKFELAAPPTHARPHMQPTLVTARLTLLPFTLAAAVMQKCGLQREGLLGRDTLPCLNQRESPA